jgi:hypothetical protein
MAIVRTINEATCHAQLLYDGEVTRDTHEDEQPTGKAAGDHAS